MLHDRQEGLDETPQRRRDLPRLRPARRSPRPAGEVDKRLHYLRQVLLRGLALILPEKDEANALGYSFHEVEGLAGLAPGTGRAFLDGLAELGYLRREIHGFVLLCPRCAKRTVDHVFLERDQRSPCPGCKEPFSFEEGRLERIHTYTPTRLAFRAVALGRLVTDEERVASAREPRPRPSPRHSRLERQHRWKRWRES